MTPERLDKILTESLLDLTPEELARVDAFCRREGISYEEIVERAVRSWDNDRHA
jgi:hypothetical protein